MRYKDAELTAKVGSNLSRLRKKARMSQIELSVLSGITEAYICQIEKGRTPNPGIVTIKRLTDAIGVPLAEVFR